MRCTQQMVSMERKNRVTIHTKSGGNLLLLSRGRAFRARPQPLGTCWPVISSANETIPSARRS